MVKINLKSVIKRESEKEVPTRQISKVTYVLNKKTGEMHTLNDSAAYIWNQLEKKIIVSNLVSKFRKKFNLTQKKAEMDVINYLKYCFSEGLVIVIN